MTHAAHLAKELEDIETASEAAAIANSAIQRLRQAEALIRQHAEQFRYYERNHRAKGTDDATRKAEVNAELAQAAELFLGTEP